MNDKAYSRLKTASIILISLLFLGLCLSYIKYQDLEKKHKILCEAYNGAADMINNDFEPIVEACYNLTGDQKLDKLNYYHYCKKEGVSS